MEVDHYLHRLSRTDPIRVRGKVTQVVGLVIEGKGPPMAIGDLCRLLSKEGKTHAVAEVVGFRDKNLLMMALGETNGLEPGSILEPLGREATVAVGEDLLGRVIDPLGEPLDGKGPVREEARYPLYAEPLNPLQREEITDPLDVGVRVINGLLTCGRGQRMGIMAGSGVGKSMLLGMIARHTSADVNVIALIGERGREVKEFINRDLGEEGLRRSVVVVATSDRSPLIRMRGAFVATAIAEFFRDQGKDVILMMDSLTRFAMAQREIGLSVGEPPTTRGYTPSVFALLPRLLERAGPVHGRGSITGFYTVLVEGDDMNEPIADASRAILDGHIVLTRELASQGHYPAVDVLQSLSRLMIHVVEEEHMKYAQKLIDLLATYKRSEDLVTIGAYTRGSNPKLDRALDKLDRILAYLRQDYRERVDLQRSVEELKEIFADEV